MTDYKNLKKIVNSYMGKVPDISYYCNRCLKTERWDKSVILMIVDASFDSLGLSYFQTVVPKVEEFRKRFMENGKIKTVEDLSKTEIEELRNVWKSKRSWQVAKEIASYLAGIKRERKLDDRQAFIHWGKKSKLEQWEKDPIGKINGVGINTFQYLRMMAGIDTVMPDKIVKRVIGKMFEQAGINMPQKDYDFIKQVESIAQRTGYKATEICWMTWLIQSEAGLIRVKKYADVLPKI